MDRVKLTSISLPINEDGSTIEDILVSRDNSIEEAADNAMLEELVSSSGLSKKEEKILALSLEGLTVREIGVRMGVSHVMVIKMKSHIKTKWRAKYENN